MLESGQRESGENGKKWRKTNRFLKKITISEKTLQKKFKFLLKNPRKSVIM